jgi:hypothetical protein
MLETSWYSEHVQQMHVNYLQAVSVTLLRHQECMNDLVWSIVGMIMTGETKALGEKPVAESLCLPRV